MQYGKPYFILPILFLISFYNGKGSVTFQINMVMYYMVFFYIGYLVNRYYERVAMWCRKKWILLVSGVVVALLYMDVQRMWSIKIITALAGIVFVIGITQYINLKICDNRVYSYIKKNNFGVYLFHPMIIYLLFYYFGAKDINPILLCSMILVVTYLISMLAIYIIRKLKIGILIGE